MGLRSRSTECRRRLWTVYRSQRTLTTSDILHKDKIMIPIRSRSPWEVVSSVEQGTPQRQCHAYGKTWEDVETPTT